MYQGVPSKKSCAEAWVAACSKIIETKNEGYNVIIDVSNPVEHSEKDNKAISLVDNLLKEYDTYPIATVANTIFPQSLLDAHGPEKFYDVYHQGFETFSQKKWGRYFERMTRHRDVKGEITNPLKELIGKLRKSEQSKGTKKAAYEIAVDPLDSCDNVANVNSNELGLEGDDITIYQPSRDRKILIGGPCLSYLSFKRHPDEGLLLTAMYRNHYYVARLLGNLIGLGRLQAFVAKESHIPVGSLTIISTHAEIDSGKWGIRRARSLVEEAYSILHQ